MEMKLFGCIDEERRLPLHIVFICHQLLDLMISHCLAVRLQTAYTMPRLPSHIFIFDIAYRCWIFDGPIF